MRLAADLRYAVRSFARTPGIAAILILTIAAGVGGNAAIFGFIGGLIGAFVYNVAAKFTGGLEVEAS